MDKSLRSWTGPSTEAIDTIDCFWVVAGLVTDLNIKHVRSNFCENILCLFWVGCLEPT